MDFILKEIKRAETKKVSHVDALQSAIRIERSMLEKKCFDIFTPTDKAIEEIFCKLNDETEKHLKMIEEELRKS